MQAVADATKTAIITIKEVDNLFNNVRPIHATPKSVAQC